MRSEVYSLSYVDGMIDYLEGKIEENAVTESLLNTMQKWVDEVETLYRGTDEFSGYYSRLLELQTLIFGENNQEDRALEFMKEAVRQAGGVPKLYSHLLKEFIARRTQQQQQPEPVPVVNAAALQHEAELEQAEPGYEHHHEPEPAPIQQLEQQQPEPVHEHHQEHVVEDQFSDLPAISTQHHEDELLNHINQRDAKHASEYHHDRPKYRKFKIVFASVFALAVIGAAVSHFVPQTSAVSMMIVKHGEITRAKDHYDALTAQYKACSDKVNTERDAVDTASDAAVAAFNQELKNCQSILDQQNHAADVYNHLIGKS